MKIHKTKKIILYSLLFLVVFGVILQIVFWYYAEPLLKKPINKFIARQTDSLYRIEFSSLRVNFVTHSFYLNDFALIPNAVDKQKKNLLFVSLHKFDIKNVSLIELIFKKSINIRSIDFIKPQIKFINYKERKPKHSATPVTYQLIKQQIIGQILNVVNGIKIKKIVIEAGRLDFLKKLKGQSFRANNITLILNNFRVNKQSLREKSLFASDFEIIMDKYKIQLNSWQEFESDKLIISSKKKNIKLINSLLHPTKLNDTSLNIFAHIKLINLRGINFKDIYLNNNLIVNNISISNPSITLYNLPTNRTNQKKINVLSLLKKLFHIISIDSLDIYGSRLKLYSTIRSALPLLEIRDASVSGRSFHIDQSTRELKNSIKILNAHIPSLSTKIINKSHLLSMQGLNLDYGRRYVSIASLRLIPIPGIQEPTLITLSLSNIRLDKFALDSLQNNHLSLGDVRLTDGDVKITVLDKKQKKKKNSGLSLLLNNLKISNINFKYNDFADKEQSVSGKINITGNDINLAVSSIRHSKFKNLNLLLTNFSQQNPQAIQNMKFDTLSISTSKQKIKIKSLAIDLNPQADSLLHAQHKSLTYRIFTPLLELTKINLYQAIFHKKISLDSLVLDNPRIELYSYPDIASDTFNILIRKAIRKKAVKNLVELSSQVIFNLYQKIRTFNDTIYQNFKHRSDLIDSIQSFAMNLIFDIHIPNSQINIQDTTAKNISQIFDLAQDAINKIAVDSAADSTFDMTIQKLVNIRKKSEKKFFNFNELARNLVKKVSLINAKNITLKNATLTMIQKYTDKQIIVFKNLITINLLNFHLDSLFPQSCHKRLLCSDNIQIDVNKYRLNLPDSVHSIEFNHLDVNSRDSNITVSDVYISADTTRPQAKTAQAFVTSYIPNIILNQISIHKLLDSNTLEINNILITKAFFHVKLRLPSKQKITKQHKIRQYPIKQIIIHNFIAPKNIVRISSSKLNIYTIADILTKKIAIDTLTTLTQALSQTFARAIFSSTKLKLNQNKTVKGQKFYIDTKGTIWSKKIKFNISDSLKLAWDSLSIRHLDYNKLINKKQLNISYLFLNNPFILSKTNSGKQPKPITEIDIYSMIKKTLKSVQIDSSSIKNLKINTPSLTLNNISVQVKKLNIDSTTKIDTPHLFYSQNIVIEIKDYKRQISSLYSLGFSSFKANLDKKQILLTDFYYKPIVSIPEFTKLITWRQTYTDFATKTLEIKDIDWIRLLTKQSISSSLIKIKDFDLYAYNDKGIKHNYSVIKPHFVDFVLKSKIPINIRDIIMENGNIVYEEKNPDNIHPGHIEVNHTFIVLSNIKTNLDPSKQIRLHLSGDLQNKGKLNVYGYFDPDTVKYKFRIFGQLGSMQLAAFNPYLVYAANLKINSGNLEKAEFLINGSDSIATGVLKATYHNLIVEILKPGGQIQPRKRKFLSFAANVIARRNNPQLGLFYKVGPIAYVHDRSFSDIKFWIKAILTGIKSLVLFENKKEIKKIYRLKYGARFLYYL